MEQQRVIVVGGGVIGVACAYYLAKTGRHVTVVDRGVLGMGCSYGNCGFVCPSHVLPLPGPGAIRKAVAAMIRRNGPLAIKPGFNFSLWSWLLKFARRCRKDYMLEAGRARFALLQSARCLYDELVAEESLDCEWETRGLLFLFLHGEIMEEFGRTVELVREHFGIEAKRYNGDEVLALEPAVKPGLAGGWHYKGDAHLRPDKLVRAWRRVLERLGVEIRENTEVRGLVRDGCRASAVETNDGAMPADAVVVATGAWTPFLNRELGCRIPIQPGKGYSITMARPSICPSIPVIFEEHRVAAAPMQSGYRLGSTMEFAGYDTSLAPERITLLRDAAVHYLQEPHGEPVLERWYGWRPMTFDGIPFIDRSPAMENVYVAAGHNMLGVSMAPATGKLVAELIGGETPHLEPQPYSFARLAR
jgi:D-amino-acid dehydrogenase